MRHIHWFRTREKGSWIKECRCGLMRLGRLEWSGLTGTEFRAWIAAQRRETTR